MNKNGLKFDSSSRDSIRLKQNRIDSNYGYSTQLNQIKNLFESKIYLSQKNEYQNIQLINKPLKYILTAEKKEEANLPPLLLLIVHSLKKFKWNPM